MPPAAVWGLFVHQGAAQGHEVGSGSASPHNEPSARLMDHWQGRCPLTGISDPALLRASHIIPWADCESDAERLDVHNGLLLSALWDAAFDVGLVSFDDAGMVIVSPRLTTAAIDALNLRLGATLSGLTEAHRANLAWHRTKHRIEIDKRVAKPSGDA